MRRWGRVSALKGQSMEHSCQSYEEGLNLLRQIGKQRSQRGYKLSPTPTGSGIAEACVLFAQQRPASVQLLDNSEHTGIDDIARRI